MAKGTRYTPEFKAKAVRLLTESRGSYSSETKAIEQVAKDLGVAPECFASIFLKQFLHCFSAAWAAGFQQELHHMTARTKTGTSPPCLYIPET